MALCQAEESIHPGYDDEDVVEYLVTLHRGTLMEWRIYEGCFDIVARGRAMGEVLLQGLQTK